MRCQFIELAETDNGEQAQDQQSRDGLHEPGWQLIGFLKCRAGMKRFPGEARIDHRPTHKIPSTRFGQQPEHEAPAEKSVEMLPNRDSTGVSVQPRVLERSLA